MRRISSALAVLALLGTGVAEVSVASAADSWGCSYDKCLVACGKAGGNRCSIYCERQLKDKLLSKVCK